MTTGEKVMFSGRIDPELKELIDASPETNQDILNAALWQYFGGRNKSTLEAKKQHKLEQKQAIEKAIESEEQDLRRIEQEIERIQAQIEQAEASEEQLERHLETLEERLQSGERMWPVRVKNVAGVDRDIAEKLYKELKDRNPDLPECAFQEPGIHTPADWRKIEK